MRWLCGIGLLGLLPLHGELMVVQPVVAQFDGGPSVAANYAFGGGESIFLSFDIAGAQPEGDEDKKLRLSWECQVFDSAGVAMTEPKRGEVNVDLAPEDKKWRPRIRVELVMPQALAAGAGEIRLTAVDHVAKANAALAVPFRTRGLSLSGVTGLAALRFRFLRSEDSAAALSPAAYRPGDTVWARFEMAGYRLGEGNSFQVSYGLEVLRANGESLFTQEEAANESGKSLYPRRYLTGALSLQLTRDLAPGEYVILLRLRDGNSEQRAESRHTFLVE